MGATFFFTCEILELTGASLYRVENWLNWQVTVQNLACKLSKRTVPGVVRRKYVNTDYNVDMYLFLLNTKYKIY